MKKVLVIFFISVSPLSFTFSQGFFKLHWHDEFNGTVLDPTKWECQIGTGASEGLTDWGNNEQQYYTQENVEIKDGFLTIIAKKEQKGNKSFTSGRLYTRGKFSTTYGRIEARISLPAITGMWPAFWMLPQDSPYGNWAASGEIDIMEAKGRLPEQYSGAIHYGGNWPNNVYSSTDDYKFPDNGTIGDFHVYAIEWKEGEIAWYCDGQLLKKITSWYSDNGTYPAPFDVDFYILLNLAVGGHFDENKVPPANFISGEMKVDYVRIYKWDDDLTAPEIPNDYNSSITPVNMPGITISQSGDHIIVNSKNQVKTFSLYSVNGALVLQANNTNVINTSGLNKGCYILKMQDINDIAGVFKVIVP